VWPIIYPAGLTPTIQLALGSVVLALNVLIYVRLFRQWKHPTRSGSNHRSS
jgi:hypothetical protein